MDEPVGLRERKKARTRRDIVAATVELCRRDGFEAATVAAIADRAEVSQRTFFRFFAVKEEAVLGPESELFDEVVVELGRVPAGSGVTVLDALADAIATATTRFDDAWWARFADAARVVDAVPTVEAAGLQFCARTQERFRAALPPADPATDGLVVELAWEAGVSAWRLARRDWLRDGAPDPGALRALLERTVHAVSAAVALPV